MAKFLKNIQHIISKKYWSRGGKTKDFPKYGGNLHSKRDMCMHHILAKSRNTNCSLYHAQAKELDAQYAANVCTSIAPVIDYIWRHVAADIQMPAPVGSKDKIDNGQQSSGDAKRRYEEERHLVGLFQRGVSENMEKLPRQGSNVEKTRVIINSWAASHKEKWRHVPKN